MNSGGIVIRSKYLIIEGSPCLIHIANMLLNVMQKVYLH